MAVIRMLLASLFLACGVASVVVGFSHATRPLGLAPGGDLSCETLLDSGGASQKGCAEIRRAEATVVVGAGVAGLAWFAAAGAVAVAFRRDPQPAPVAMPMAGGAPPYPLR
ncbi:MAG: hypothetical protein GEV10_18670 [Streptosporangiales bacterium]|nr:hypothetical protein [Streptosporangiales bacterium]